MLIANPIYDVVFKYLMEDSRIAQTFISTIIGEEVLEMHTVSQELTHEQVTIPESDGIPSATIALCRLDFAARIQTPAGEKKVAIELQKAKEVTDLMRFRRYIGLHYSGKGETDSEYPPQIYCIYLLGYDATLPPCPVLLIDPAVKNVATGETLKVNNPFINGLHHRSWIVQIKLLKPEYHNEMEQLLAVFDQSNHTEDFHILNVREEDFPEKFRPIIRRLQMAQSTQDIRKVMHLEDEIVEEFRVRERNEEKLHEVIDEQQRLIAEQAKRIAELERVAGQKA
ncbi:MAG: hypothetical protein Ta2A_11750 [Treponemataceae bacterium]|nr:MAG: hypothetical protein Ta2A_11750 [Treponemataceae bacterium]